MAFVGRTQQARPRRFEYHTIRQPRSHVDCPVINCSIAVLVTARQLRMSSSVNCGSASSVVVPVSFMTFLILS